MNNLEGRNEIRFNNAGGRCLLENWVEERATQHLEDEVVDTNRDELNCAQTLQNGHKFLLTQKDDVSADTTNRVDFKSPQFPRVATQGKMQSRLLNDIINEVTLEQKKQEQAKFDQMNLEMNRLQTKSVKQADFDKENFVFKPPTPVQHHDLYNESQLSFWSDNPEKIHGKSATRVANAPFRKNAAFSKPHWEYRGEELPHGINNQ